MAAKDSVNRVIRGTNQVSVNHSVIAVTIADNHFSYIYHFVSVFIILSLPVNNNTNRSGVWRVFHLRLQLRKPINADLQKAQMSINSSYVNEIYAWMQNYELRNTLIYIKQKNSKRFNNGFISCKFTGRNSHDETAVRIPQKHEMHVNLLHFFLLLVIKLSLFSTKLRFLLKSSTWTLLFCNAKEKLVLYMECLRTRLFFSRVCKVRLILIDRIGTLLIDMKKRSK